MAYAVETFVRMANEPGIDRTLKKALIQGIGSIGGAQAKQYLESQVQSASLFGRLNSERNEIQKLVKSFLEKMP